jgi:hypothetical protein
VFPKSAKRFLEKNTLRLLGLARFLVARTIPFERKARFDLARFLIARTIPFERKAR